MAKEQVKERKSRDPLYITIIVLLLGTSAFFGYSWNQQRQEYEKCKAAHDSLFAEREELKLMLEGNGMIDLASENLKDNLQLMLDQYGAMEVSNDTMRAKISAQEEKIRNYMAEAEKHKHDAYAILKLRKETETLRKIMRSYVHTIDSLNTLTQNLRADIQVKDNQIKDVTEERDKVLDKNKTLEETVAKGSLLQAGNIKGEAIRLRNSGTQVVTTRAGKTDQIKCCFTLMENRIAKAGVKDIYMVVITPGGSILTGDPGATLVTNEGNTPFSGKREVDYQNANLDMCIFLEKIAEDLKAGTYIIKIYADKAVIGKTTFTLK